MSQKSEDDDKYQEVLTKYMTTNKKMGDVMNKENGEEAANEIYEKMNQVDTMVAIDKVKAVFEKTWAEHDPSHKNIIEQSEAYNFLQDIVRSGSG